MDTEKLRKLISIENTYLEFLDASNRMRKLMAELNVYLPEPNQDIGRKFSNLPMDHRLAAIEQLNFYTDICEFASSNDYDQNDLRLTWYAISKYHLKGPSELFRTLSDQDCIEIYSASGTQLFRSFNFFKYCSYSPEDLIVNPWQDLYGRDMDIVSQMEKVAGKALTQSNTVFHIGLPNHKVWETKSTKRIKAEVSFKVCSPLFNESKQRTAFLVSSRIELLKEKSKRQPRTPEASL